MTISVFPKEYDASAIAPDVEITLSRVSPRHYLMCPPTYFSVDYAINAWMDPDAPVDRVLAMSQWERLRDTYLGLGHQVSTLEPQPGLPDMVFAANGALVVDGRVYGASFHNDQRRAEAPAHRDWFTAAGYSHIHAPEYVNEGEGDYAVAGEFVLAGTGFRTEPASHREAQEFFGRPVITLDLVDPRFYHLDTALFALDEDNIAYYPGAFSPGSQGVLRHLFPRAVIADEADAVVLGLNSVSDGRNVVVAESATGLIRQLRQRGFHPVGVDLSELLKAGGGAKCCTQELRAATEVAPLRVDSPVATAPGGVESAA
jgi:N-dimethylarginine dimethylaminohydrolase